MPQDTSGIHPASLVDSVAPDIKDGLGGPNDPTDKGARGHSNPQHEVVEGVLVDVLQLVVQLRREIYQVAEVIVGVVLRISWCTVINDL